jgi:hypothetical protein
MSQQEHMPVTAATCWSVRQCIERAAALDSQSDAVVAQLDQLEYQIDMTEGIPRWSEHQAAIDHIAALLQLTEHLIVNLKSGMALPPTPGTVAAQRREPVPATHTRRVEQPPAYKPPPPAATPPAPPAPKKPSKPSKQDPRQAPTYNGRAETLQHLRKQGLLNTADMLAALRISKGAFHVARHQRRVPEPSLYDHGMPFWTREQLAQCRMRGSAAAHA